MINIANIPQELTIYKQWVCWKYVYDADTGEKTKIPYNPKTGRAASSTDRFSWVAFSEAVSALDRYDGLGFILTRDDPYCVMDLDAVSNDEDRARLERYYFSLSSYTEISPSGTGSHIWIKGEVPRGRNSRPFEIYSFHRFMTVTGNVHFNTAIEYRQDEITAIWNELGEGKASILTTYDGNDPIPCSDQEVLNRATAAKNGYKFSQLWFGKFQEWYASQSEADFALVDILAYYTQNAEQISRLFRWSELGKRDKAQRDDYMELMIKKSFDRLPPKANLDTIAESIAAMQAKFQQEADTLKTAPVEHAAMLMPTQEIVPAQQLEVVNTQPRSTWLNDALPIFEQPVFFPKGLVGDIAQYIYDSSPRPIKEVALTAAIGLMAGICGSSYNVSAQGLNQYVLVLASTGMGKENMGGGISRLMSQVKLITPSAMRFIGASQIQSPQALLKFLDSKSKSAVFMIGECGLWLKELSDPRAPANITGQRRLLLELYGKSGRNDQVHPMIYADSDKNTNVIQSPSVTLVGDSTQERFYGNVDESLIAEGFIPRWLIIEYNGQRPALNENHHAVVPAAQLVQNLATLCYSVHSMLDTHSVIDVAFMDDDVRKEASEFNTYCDAQYNASTDEALRNLWTRAYLMTLKLAALCAVGRNIGTPSIDHDDWNFAKFMVLRNTLKLCRNFSTGALVASLNNEASKQHAAVKRLLVEFVAGTSRTSDGSYGVTSKMRSMFVVPYSLISRKLTRNSAFAKSGRGASNAIQQAIRDFVLSGVLIELTPQQTQSEFNTSGKLYTIADPSALLAKHNADD